MSGDDIKKGAKTVVVMSALPSAHEFILGDGSILTIGGRPESLFVGENRLPLQGNQFGRTEGVKVEDWRYVRKVYGSMAMLKNNVIFAAESMDEEKGKKKELKTLETGLEQIDPKKDNQKNKNKKTKTKPADKKDD